MRGREKEANKDHLGKAHPGWAETSVQSVRNMVTGKINVQKTNKVTVKKEGELKKGKVITHVKKDLREPVNLAPGKPLVIKLKLGGKG